MSCNDIFMLLFARKAECINRRFAEMYKDLIAKPADKSLLDKLGSR